jgi:hypothetical protein
VEEARPQDWSSQLIGPHGIILANHENHEAEAVAVQLSALESFGHLGPRLPIPPVCLLNECKCCIKFDL